MNVFLIVVLLILISFTIAGYWRGFVRIAFSLVSMILLIVLVSWITPKAAEFLKENTEVYQNLEEICTKRIQDLTEETMEKKREEQLAAPAAEKNLDEEGADQEGILEMLPIPKVWVEQILDKAQHTVVQVMEEGGLYRQIGAYLADWMLQGIAFFVSYFLCAILLRLVIGLLDVVSKLPVIKGVNRMLGAAAGLAQGMVVVWLLLFFVAIACTSQLGRALLADIEASPILAFLYQHNAILYFFHHMFGI